MRKARLPLAARYRNAGAAGSVGRRKFESVFVDFHTLDLGLEGPRGQTESRRRRDWSRDSAGAFRQRGFNHFFFLSHDGAIQRTRPAWGGGQFPLQPALVHGKGFALAEDDRTLDYILQFANVPRPAVSFKQFERLLIDRLELLSRPFPKTIREVLHH